MSLGAVAQSSRTWWSTRRRESHSSCMENQTRSTDAHNLYAKGLEKEAHLLIAEKGRRFLVGCTWAWNENLNKRRED